MVKHPRIANHVFFEQRDILSIEQLHGGLNHTVHKVSCKDITVVTRYANDTHSEFAELHLQAELADSGLTPKILSLDDGIAVMTYVSGQHPTRGKWQTHQLKRFAELLANLHRHKTSCEAEHLALEQHIDQLLAQVSVEPKQQPLVDKAQDALSELYQLPVQAGLCHHDLNPLNIIIQQQKIWLIDWECVGFGDVFFDLASFIVEQALEQPNSAVFLQHYLNESRLSGKLSPTQLNNKLHLMKIAYCLVCWLWYLQRQQHQPSGNVNRTDWYYQQLQQLLT